MFGGGGKIQYDRALTVFSPEGRLYQVEYALEAVRRGTLIVGIKTKTDVCLAAQIKLASPLMEAESIDKLFKIDDHIGCAISGLHADSRILINYSRVQSQSYRLTYDEPVKLRMLVKTIADIKQMYTQHGGIRPFGCSLFFIAVDSDGPQIFTTSPSGIYRSFKAYALGAGEANAREFIEKEYDPAMSLKEIQLLAMRAIKESIDEEITPDNVKCSYISGEEKKFTMLSKTEVSEFVKGL
jgi:proteasome alpha subunit